MSLRAALIYLPVLVSIALGLQHAQAQMQDTVGPVTIEMPAQWRRQVRADGAIAYEAPDASAEVEFMAVNTPADAASVHRALWAETRKQMQAPAHESTGRLARFHWSQMQAFDPAQNRRIWLRLYTSGEGAAHACALVGSVDEHAFQRGVEVIDAVLSNAQFASASRAAPAQHADDTPIVESLVHVDVRAVSLGSNVRTDHILFFGNGIAVRSGVIDGPRECYAALPVGDLASLPSNYGRWRQSASGAQMDVEWQEGPSWRLMREGERWSLEGKKLLKLRPVDGARFDGTYVYRPVGDSPTVLKLASDGRFEALNLTESMTCATGAPFVRQGVGSYAVRKWTLVLRFDGAGGVVMLPIHIRDDERDLQRVGGFTVKSYAFSRM